MTCHNCNSLTKKSGWFISGSKRIQRYRCKQCGKSFGDIPPRPLDELRTPVKDASHALHLLCEGVGIRAAERLTGLHRDTVMAVLAIAGAKCARLLDRRVRGIQCDDVQVDEMWCFVGRKQKNSSETTPDIGDQYIWLAIDAKTKLILAHIVGKRDNFGASRLIRQLRDRVISSFQLTTDGFAPYRNVVPGEFHDEHTVHFAQLQKLYSPVMVYPKTLQQFNALRPDARYSPPKCTGAKKTPIMGHPDWDKICTSHVERQNLSMRLFNRRLTRLTMGFSRKLANLKHSVALQIAYHNFVRVHSAHGQTPAMAAGLADKPWTIQRLLSTPAL